MTKEKTDLRTIPGVGKATEQDLLALGYTCVEDLRGQDPEEIYTRDCILQNEKIDRCQLYVYRLAVYYAHQTQILTSCNGGSGKIEKTGLYARPFLIPFQDLLYLCNV